MNKLIAAYITTIILLLSSNVMAGTGTFISPTADASGNGNESDDVEEEVTGTVGTFEQIVTVIKNEKPEAFGNLFCSLPSELICPDSDSLSLELSDSPVGNYGFLDINANGKFHYVIKSDLQQVQALDFNDVAEEIFNYTIREENGVRTNAS